MKFNQVNDVQVQQYKEAVAVIQKLRRNFAKQRLAKHFRKCYCSDVQFEV